MYSIRLSLQRFTQQGELLTLPFDLWREADEAVVLRGEVNGLKVKVEAEMPYATEIIAAVRFADTPDPASADWGAFLPMALDEAGTGSIEAQARWMQVRLQLSTDNPLLTPRVGGLAIARELTQHAPPAKVHVVSVDNPLPSLSSYWQTPATFQHPQLEQLRERLGLDKLLAGVEGDFERINLVRHHVSQLWKHQLPYPEYPEWSAHAVLDRNENHGWGGMCMQFVVVFTQALQSLGYHARHVNTFNHESAEVWVDELGKWVLVDPESVFDSYEFDTRTGNPLNVGEQHAFFLRRYGFDAQRPIPWMSPESWCNWPTPAVAETPQPLDISTFTPALNHPDPLKRPPQHNLAGFFRIIPRNDFLERPTPRPLNNGSTYWPWNGYLCWYDPATPRKLQYALHSDRLADFYPTLNRVHFSATYTDRPGEIALTLFTHPAEGNGFETKIGEQPWQSLQGSVLRWQLRQSALNKLQLRTRNTLGVSGKASSIEVFWHYQPAFAE